jgi:hypothetical protein
MPSQIRVGISVFMLLVAIRSEAGGSCQAIVQCPHGTANCQATTASDGSSEFYDSAICESVGTVKVCKTLRKFDRGPRAGNEVSLNPTYICCGKTDNAIATPNLNDAQALCAQ